MQTSRLRQRLGEPIAWFTFAIPALTAIAGIWTLHLTAAAHATDEVTLPHSRIAQVQESDLTPDIAAAQLHLTAALVAEKETIRLTFTPPMPQSVLTLQLDHPVNADQDVRLTLRPVTRQHITYWTATLPRLAAHDWNATLTDARGTWRLIGRWHKGAPSLALHPAVAAP